MNALGCFAAGGCAISTVAMASVVLHFADMAFDYDAVGYVLRHFLISVPFSLLFLLNIPMRWTSDRQKKKMAVKHLTFLLILIQGITGTIDMLRMLPPSINSYPAYFWFTYGVLFFFLAAANFLDLIAYGGIYFAAISIYMVQSGDFALDEKLTLTVMLFQLLHFTPVALLARSRIRAIRHAFRQLEKVFYPHQIRMIRGRRELEQTMPTFHSEACVICFDIISSSTIQHPGTKDFLRNLFARCSSLMMEGYNGIDMASQAYRIKEMGDGFLCSVGYPFRSQTDNMTQDALNLAQRFYAVFHEEVRKLNYPMPIHCSIGIAQGWIAGFYPQSGAKEYDLHGRAIALATRYESMRKLLFSPRPPESILILQEKVWLALAAEEQAKFTQVNLSPRLAVRDDPDAQQLFYMLLTEPSHAPENAPMHHIA